jgi:hypothetical protein
MRSIRKVVKVDTIVRTLYDRVAKQEREETINVPEGLKTAEPLPENCILVEEKVIESKTVKYAMSPETFFTYATIIEG